MSRAGAGEPFGKGVLLADTSAWVRAPEPAVAARWQAGLRGGLIATSPPVALEILYTARDGDEFVQLELALDALPEAPITRSVTAAARRAMADLAGRGGAAHRVPVPDLLVAAAAAERGFGVLHYDPHFDRLAEVLPFESVWIAPAGSLA